MQGYNMRILQYVSIALFIVGIGVWLGQTSPHYQILKGEIFGTYYSIKIKTDNKNKELKDDIKAILYQINQEMSVFEPSGELSQINRTPAEKNIVLSENMQQVLKAASVIYRQSAGKFDPTLGALIDMWGFGAGHVQEPSDKQIKQALSVVGFNKLKFGNDFKTLRKTNTKTMINLSAIAKGYAVDKLAELLDKQGYRDYIVEIGGEIKAKGTRDASGAAWNVGIRKPSVEAEENALVVSLDNLAVATSGNYRNYYRKDGKIFAHTISATTGRPFLSDALSASVFHASCMYADAYATAVMTMGVEQGLRFADKHDLAVIVFDNEFQPHFSQKAQEIFGE
jgi:thiamine biosynthesis lipoprotein